MKTKMGHFPDSNNWCDLVLEQNKSVPELDFMFVDKHDNSCDFAFNSNLSGLPIDGLDPNTVLIFEADGPWNFAAGPEKFPGTRYICLLPHARFRTRIFKTSFRKGSLLPRSLASLMLRYRPL
jgi:hypothetical protein